MRYIFTPTTCSEEHAVLYDSSQSSAAIDLVANCYPSKTRTGAFRGSCMTIGNKINAAESDFSLCYLLCHSQFCWGIGYPRWVWCGIGADDEKVKKNTRRVEFVSVSSHEYPLHQSVLLLGHEGNNAT